MAFTSGHLEHEGDIAQDFGQFARTILVDKRAQRAFLARARRGDLPAHTIRMFVEKAAPAPEPARATPTTAEVAACLAASVPPFIQLLMYDHARGRLDDRGRPVRRAGRKAARKAEAPKQEPAREPDLAEDQPLAAAAERMRAAEAEQQDRSRAVELDLSQVPDPQPSKEELRAMGRAPREEHDWRDREHRAECRASRRMWRADGADPTLIRR